MHGGIAIEMSARGAVFYTRGQLPCSSFASWSEDGCLGRAPQLCQRHAKAALSSFVLMLNCWLRRQLEVSIRCRYFGKRVAIQWTMEFLLILLSRGRLMAACRTLPRPSPRCSSWACPSRRSFPRRPELW